MSLRKVPRAQWAGVLERFSREHPAWLATVLDVQGDVQAIRAEWLRLRAVAPRVLRIDETGLAPAER